MAEFDALWDSTPAGVEQFATMLTAAPSVNASIARSTGAQHRPPHPRARAAPAAVRLRRGVHAVGAAERPDRGGA